MSGTGCWRSRVRERPRRARFGLDLFVRSVPQIDRFDRRNRRRRAPLRTLPDLWSRGACGRRRRSGSRRRCALFSGRWLRNLATRVLASRLCFRRQRRGSFDLALESWRRSRGSTSRDRGGRAARAGGRTTRARGGGSSSPRRQRAKDRVILTADQDSVRLLAQLVANLHVRDECPALDEVLLLADASVEVILERVGHGAPIVERLAQAGQPLDGAILYGRDPLGRYSSSCFLHASQTAGGRSCGWSCLRQTLVTRMHGNSSSLLGSRSNP